MKRILSFVMVLVLLLPNMNVNSNAEFSVSASAAILVNADTGEVLFSKDADKKLPMASTTKIMTAILLIENADLDKEIVTTKEMVTVEGSSMGLLEDDKITYRTLLYGMMLPSGNDAATTVAISLGGSLENFALMMNRKAQELKMDNTNFVTPSGLDSELHYTTAGDMAKLAVYAMKNPLFKEVVSTDEIRVEYGNPPYSRSLFGHNKLLENYNGANGIKTGYTSKSGRCLVSSATRGNKNLIAVTLNDSNTVSTHSKLLDYGFTKLNDVTLELPYEFSKIPVISGQKDYARLTVLPKVIALSADERESLEYKISLKPFIYAPQDKGTAVGYIEFFTKNGKIATLNIKTKQKVKLIKEKQRGFAEMFIFNLLNLIK